MFKCYSRTRIKETLGYKKRFHSSAFMQDKLSTLIGQPIKETWVKETLSLPPYEFLLSELDCIQFLMLSVWKYFEGVAVVVVCNQCRPDGQSTGHLPADVQSGLGRAG